jgi:hypothetical protein
MNRENGGDDSMDIGDVGKPRSSKKIIHVIHDNKTGTYSGLPLIWRQLLEMPSV